MDFRFSEIEINSHFRWEGSEYKKISEDNAVKVKNNEEVRFNDHVIVRVKEK